MTIYNTPILSRLLHYVAKFCLRASGWCVEGSLPALPRFVVIGAPHTSNWDFVLFLGMVFQLQANVYFMGKAELFRPPFGIFFRYCGGIPVDRKKSQGLVEQMVKAINESEEFILVIAPEGTRHKAHAWKTGFYHIAKSAEIPIVLAVVDGAIKTVRVGQVFHLTGDMEADMRAIQGFFTGMVGLKPSRQGLGK